RRPASRSRVTNIFAARIGPTVCELEGPMPTENRSNTLMVTERLLLLPLRVPMPQRRAVHGNNAWRRGAECGGAARWSRARKGTVRVLVSIVFEPSRL